MLDELRVVGDHHVFNTIIRNTVKLGEAPLVGRPITSYAGIVRRRAHLPRARPGGDRTWPGLTSAPPPRAACPRSASSRPPSSASCRRDGTPRDRRPQHPASTASSPTREQPRLAFDEEALDELAASIREHGVLQPVLVRPLGERRFQLIAGERRWRARGSPASTTIPALVEDIDDETALEISIIENLQREDLSPLDEAAMYDRMIRDTATASGSSPRSSARTRATSRTGSASPMRRRRSASSCLCAKTRCRMPTS